MGVTKDTAEIEEKLLSSFAGTEVSFVQQRFPKSNVPTFGRIHDMLTCSSGVIPLLGADPGATPSGPDRLPAYAESLATEWFPNRNPTYTRAEARRATEGRSRSRTPGSRSSSSA